MDPARTRLRRTVNAGTAVATACPAASCLGQLRVLGSPFSMLARLVVATEGFGCLYSSNSWGHPSSTAAQPQSLSARR
jgi:class 3 adenylate cyclase